MTPPAPTLFPSLRDYCDRLARLADSGLSTQHLAAARQVGNWIRDRLHRGLPANLIVVCTGNSRRSLLGSTLGNVVAAYVELPSVRFFSGGTVPSAFNPRTIRALQEIGVRIEDLHDPAPVGTSGENNPKYRLEWGETSSSHTVEFSKRYDDPTNPPHDFCAIMVCTDADENCPVVQGASLRVSMPFGDPKDFDGRSTESEAYALRRDQIGQAMLLMLKP